MVASKSIVATADPDEAKPSRARRRKVLPSSPDSLVPDRRKRSRQTWTKRLDRKMRSRPRRNRLATTHRPSSSLRRAMSETRTKLATFIGTSAVSIWASVQPCERSLVPGRSAKKRPVRCGIPQNQEMPGASGRRTKIPGNFPRGRNRAIIQHVFHLVGEIFQLIKVTLTLAPQGLTV